VLTSWTRNLDFQGNSGTSKRRVLTSLWDFAPNSGLGKFRHGISIAETCYQLSSRKVDAQRVIHWTSVGQLSWQYLRAPMLDHCSLSQWSSSSVYSTVSSTGSNKPCSQRTNSTELNWTELRSGQPCSQSASWRWRARPITRRVTGSTWCRSVQFNSSAVNTALATADTCEMLVVSLLTKLR